MNTPSMFEKQKRGQEEREGWGVNKCFEGQLGSTLDNCLSGQLLPSASHLGGTGISQSRIHESMGQEPGWQPFALHLCLKLP